MKIIYFDGRVNYWKTHFIFTKVCNDCERGASLILDEDVSNATRSHFHEKFLKGVVRRIADDNCKCFYKSRNKPTLKWATALVEEDSDRKI